MTIIKHLTYAMSTAVGNISADICCNNWSLVGVLGGTQACLDWRWISGHKHCSICCVGYKDFGCDYDSSGLFIYFLPQHFYYAVDAQDKHMTINLIRCF